MLKTIFQTAAAIIFSMGGAGAVLFGLSNFIGQNWADRSLEAYKRELDLKYDQQLIQQTRQAKLYEEFAMSLEDIFAGRNDPRSLELNKMFALLALYAPDEVYSAAKEALEGIVFPRDVKPVIYSALRKQLFRDKTAFTQKDLIKHIKASDIKLDPNHANSADTKSRAPD